MYLTGRGSVVEGGEAYRVCVVVYDQWANPAEQIIKCLGRHSKILGEFLHQFLASAEQETYSYCHAVLDHL